MLRFRQPGAEGAQTCGRVIAESSAILMYLAGGTRFLPGERYGRAKVVQWLSFEQYYIEPTIGSLRFWTLTGRLNLNAGRMVESRRENASRAPRGRPRPGRSRFPE